VVGGQVIFGEVIGRKASTNSEAAATQAEWN